MFKDWFRYGETEVANNQRVSTYVKNGLRPVGAVIADCGDCTDLAEANGDQPYSTPALDEAPWFSPRDPDSADFAGVTVVEVTGLEGSTTTATVEERLGDGGILGARRASSRTVAVTADVVGRTPEATSQGLEWLTAALHPPCAEGSDCTGDVLHLYSACPAACEGITDRDTAPITQVFTDPAAFTTTGATSINQSFRNLAPNPSGEGVISSWASPAVAGALVSGTLAKSGDQEYSRANSVRLTVPDLPVGQATAVVTNVVAEQSGFHEISAWVYLAESTTTGLILTDIWTHDSTPMYSPGFWVRMSMVQELVAGNTYSFGVKTLSSFAPPAGSVFYVDALTVRPLGSSAEPNISGEAQTDGWVGNSAFGVVTVPELIEHESEPGPDGAGGSVRVEWKSEFDPGHPFPEQIQHGVYNALVGLTQRQVYTVSVDILVPTGSPDVQTDVMFNANGTLVTEKDQWVRVFHTFMAKAPSQWFGVKALGPSGGPGRSVYLDNLRITPGFSPMSGSPSVDGWPSHYFDGASPDAPDVNVLAGQPLEVVSGSMATQLVNGIQWNRLTAGSTAAEVRVAPDPGVLVNGREYLVAWEVWNDQGVEVQVTLEWADGSAHVETLPPGERRRVYTRTLAGAAGGFGQGAFGLSPFGGGIAAADLRIPAGANILFRDPGASPVQPHDFQWSGAVDNSPSVAIPLGDAFIFQPQGGVPTIYGGTFPGVCDDIRVVWTVSSPSGAEFHVRAGWADESGDILFLEEPVLISAVPREIVLEEGRSVGFPDAWRPVLYTLDEDLTTPVDTVTIHGLKVTHRRILELEECVAPYRRTLQNVVTVDGPRLLEWRTLGDTTSGSTVARVEWTWVAMSPHIWHEPVDLIREASATSPEVAYRADSVTLTDPTGIPNDATLCPRPAPQVTSCADNTLSGGVLLPPQPLSLPDTGVMNMAGLWYNRRRFEIPDDVVPQGLGVLSWAFRNDAKPKFGVRVRIWEDTDPAFDPEPECAWVQEFTVEYLAPNQTLYIDNASEDVYVNCGDDVLGNPVYAPALRNVRGPYRGPFIPGQPVGCGRGLVVTVDVPDTYSYSDSPGLTGQPGGTSQGNLWWSVNLTRRS